MAISKDQILELLGLGLSNEQVSSAVGCEPSYISQLMADDDFRTQVAELRSTSLQAASKRDRQIDEIEDRLLTKLSDSIELMFKPRDMLTAFSIINKAVRRGVSAPQAHVINQQIVNLQIPQQVVKNFTINPLGEVVDIEGQTMVSMPAHELLSKLQKESPDDDKYAKAAKFLPAADVFTAATKLEGHRWGAKDRNRLAKDFSGD